MGVSASRICVLAALASCTVDAPDDSIGMITAGPVMPTAGTPTGGDDGSAGDDDDDGSSGNDGGSADDDGGGTASESGAADDGDATTAGDTGGGAGAQPEDGVYSACMAIGECVGAMYCVPAGDGFCTRDCAAPGDCPASPNGAAPTVCIPITMPAATSVCALDCGGGQACPAPMTCSAVEGSMVCV